ncbi:MAG TPA: carbon-phosphorus lyase complex subunit PhnI [Fibrobacteria bacterium]|nr:carbon-phosphorus lyase complex subunit PhnI [Fibrobacteria bacterium]
MAYVAVKGGREAIERACDLNEYRRQGAASAPLQLSQIREQLHLAVDRVMGEGGLHAPDLAALALRQAAGDTIEASFLLRAHRATLPRLGESIPDTTGDMRMVRRISSAFKDVPGGQILGPTGDYTLRLLELDRLEDPALRRQVIRERVFRGLPEPDDMPDTFPRVVELLRRDGLVEEPGTEDDEPFDITRRSVAFPAPRSARLQALARGETGGLLLLAYSSMRGYGHIHPTLAELRVGYLPLRMTHPVTGESVVAGEILVTEAEVVSRFSNPEGEPRFHMGYGLCLGHNEIKAISMGVLDRCMRTETPTCPAEDQEFVLYHTDGIESMGFSNHWKLPHYVDFLSDLDRLRKARANAQEKENGHARA